MTFNQGLGFLLAVFLSVRGQSQRWGYRDNILDEIPPRRWAQASPLCGGVRQSPIAIEPNITVQATNIEPLRFDGYEVGPIDDSWMILNTGRTVRFSGKFNKPPLLYGGGLGAVYEFSHFVFRWGATSSAGSEHTLNGKRFPLEVQIVHKKVTATEQGAFNDPSGHAIISVLFDLVEEAQRPYTRIQTAVRAVQFAIEPENEVSFRISDLDLAKLLPKSQAYYRYMGSHTAPPCSESAVWIVMADTQIVTENQLNVFRSLKIAKNSGNSPSDRLLDNWRPPQALNGRQVTFSPQLPQKAVQQPQSNNGQEDPAVGTSSRFSVLPAIYIMPILGALFN